MTDWGPYNYHDSEVRKDREVKETCRCQVAHNGRVLDAAKLNRLPDGRISNPSTPGQALTTPPLGSDGVFIYAIDQDGNLRMASDGGKREFNRDAVKHETLFHNANVIASGELQFEAGTIIGINDASGSYGTRGELDLNPRFARHVLKALQDHLIPFSDQVKSDLERLSQDVN